MNDRSRFDQPDLESLLPAVPFSRRGFLVSGAASGFALAAGPLMAQQAIKTPADGLVVAETTIPVSGGQLPIYTAAPKRAGKFPVIIVIPEVFGMHEYQKDITRRLAKVGYYADLARSVLPLGRPVEGRRRQAGHRRCQHAHRRAGVCRSRRTGRLDREAAERERATPRDHRHVPRRPDGVDVHGAQSEDQGRRRVVWTLHAFAAGAHGDAARHHRQAERTGARPLRRRRRRDSGPAGRAHARGAARVRQGQGIDHPCLSRTCRTRSTPTTGTPTARKRRRTAGSACSRGSRSTGCNPGRET